MDMIRRLATSQARGERQLSFVNELLSFRRVTITQYQIPGQYGNKTVRYGLSKLPNASFRNLRSRLISVGFVLDRDWDTMTVRMTFPEATTLF